MNPYRAFIALSATQRSLISAAVGFFGYGFWAVMMNIDHGLQAGLKAGVVQGSYSFLLTLTMTLLMEGVFNRVYKASESIMCSTALTVLFICGLVFGGSWWVNAAAGTPNILQTVLPGYIIGGAYSISYAVGLAKQARVKLN